MTEPVDLPALRDAAKALEGDEWVVGDAVAALDLIRAALPAVLEELEALRVEVAEAVAQRDAAYRALHRIPLDLLDQIPRAPSAPLVEQETP